jgi:hypothetical protein
LTGEHKFWRKYEIRAELIKNGMINVNNGLGLIGRQVNKLYAHDFLEMQQDEKCFFVQRFRLKEKFLEVKSPDELNIWFKE